MTSPIFKTSLSEFETASTKFDVVPVRAVVSVIGFRPIDAFKAGFPIGTLSGAPKIRAARLIAELEPEGRGPYCGGIGWFRTNGDIDTGTIIRSIVLRDGTAHVQTGAGIVFDSVPEAENLESLQKAKAPLLAIARAEAVHERHWQTGEQVFEPTHTATTVITAE